ncbi:Apple domain-containing protein, partial [Meloidogyne graminicola]
IVNIAKGKIPFNCTSSVFNLLENKCILYGQQQQQKIKNLKIPDINSIYYEKGCLNNNLINNNCNNNLTIQRIPQKTLIGYSIGSIYSNTLINCLENCLLINKNENKNKCKSIMFYYEENNNFNLNLNINCILNSQNYENVPSNYFVDENEVIVDYISFDNCYEQKRRK